MCPCYSSYLENSLNSMSRWNWIFFTGSQLSLYGWSLVVHYKSSIADHDGGYLIQSSVHRMTYTCRKANRGTQNTKTCVNFGLHKQHCSHLQASFIHRWYVPVIHLLPRTLLYPSGSLTVCPGHMVQVSQGLPPRASPIMGDRIGTQGNVAKNYWEFL